MSSYGYGPPPPPPPPSQPSGGYGQQYQSTYQHSQSHGGHPRGGRGGGYYGGGRGGGDHQAASGYAYGPQGSQQYGQQSHYSNAASHHGQAGYGAPSQQQHPPQQQWSHDPAAQGQHQPHNPLPPQNYHPNYAPQMYQQQPPQSHSPPQHQPPHTSAPYGQQPPYAPAGSTASQPPYGHQYPHPAQQSNGPPSQQWAGSASHGQQNGGHGGHYSGRGRGGGSSYHHDRGGGSKAQMMGPPIRIGFENGGPQGQVHGSTAPVSNGYPPQPPYGAPQGAPAPPPGPAGYAAGPYQAYPPTGPSPVAGPPQHYDPYYSQNSRHHARGGFQSNSHRGSRPHFGGDKIRHKKPNGVGPHVGGSYPPSHHQKPDAASTGKKKKRKTNTLGLTPGDESDEDEIDEEAKLVEMIGPDAPNPVDIAGWIAQRRQNFPTQARVKAKLAESSDGDKANKADAAANGGGKNVAGLTALERQQQKAEKLRKQLEKVESSIKRKREQQDEGDEMRDVDGASSDSSSDSKSDDEAPEALPIRSETAATTTAAKSTIPPAAKKADPTKHCKYYSTGGACGKKGKCRFVHDPAVREAALQERERNGGRITLQQRLILNDKDQEDLTIVKTLQYLKEKGIMKDSAPDSASQASSSTAHPESSSTAISNVAATNTSESRPAPDLPIAPSLAKQPSSKHQQHGLPTQPPPSSLLGPPGPASSSATNGAAAPTQRYQGWDLSGFGNTGVKSDDL